MPCVYGFATRDELLDHFDKHVIQRREFSFATEDEYEAAAIEFMTRPLDSDTEERTRLRDSAVIRLNRRTNEIGIVHADGYIGSYFRVRLSDPYGYFLRTCRGGFGL